jgi:cellulose synthase/poly-beta-1,6-N-acetylglucosamine synthase-like glycosyltransferase
MNPIALAIFLTGVFWLAYVYAGYPVILAIIALFRRARPKHQAYYAPAVSVLISARDEEKDIGWKVRETLDWDYPGKLEVLVASDASTDRTDEVLAEIRDPRLKWIRIEKRGGKGKALNELARMASGEIFFFTDANAHVEPQSLEKMVRHFSDPQVGCVTGDSWPISDRDRQVMDGGAGVYWGVESLVKNLESSIGSVLVCDGAIFCVRRSLYVPVDPELANDLESPMHVGDAGYWLLHEPGARVFEHETSSPKEEFGRRRRIAAQGALGMWRLRHTMHGLRGWQFFSHKFLRWLTPVPLALILIGSLGLAGNRLFDLLIAAQVIFYAAAAAGSFYSRSGLPMNRLLAVPFYVLLCSLGTVAGFIDACRGRRFNVWEIPAMSRGRAEAAVVASVSSEK